MLTALPSVKRKLRPELGGVWGRGKGPRRGEAWGSAGQKKGLDGRVGGTETEAQCETKYIFGK